MNDHKESRIAIKLSSMNSPEKFKVFERRKLRFPQLLQKFSYCKVGAIRPTILLMATRRRKLTYKSM